jgi:hypothetical protein
MGILLLSDSHYICPRTGSLSWIFCFMVLDSSQFFVKLFFIFLNTFLNCFYYNYRY